MNAGLLYCYHRLPAPLRSAAASLRGLYLRSWRYSPKTERFVEEALERDQWDSERWKLWQQEQVALLLHRAVTRVPYYREHWTARRRKGDHASWKYLENWPILKKETVRQKTSAFLAEDCNRQKMFCEHTSGTTGKPLELWWSRETVQSWYALFEARCRRWYGVSRWDRWAIIGGQLVTSVFQRQPPFWVWNTALSQLYMSSYHLAPELIPHYVDALKKYKIKYIFGYSSSLYTLAQETLRQGIKDLQMTVAITNAEPLFDYQREEISEAFQCPVRETYGMAEIVAAASECTKGRLHLWPEVGSVEVFEDDGRHDTPGDLVCTGLLNMDMPLIRYRVGDRAALLTRNELCTCGRGLPTLESLEGRSDDVLYTTDGRRVGRLDPVFKANIPVREAQIIQEALDRVRVRYVPAPGYTPEVERSIIRGLRERLGGIQVTLEEVDKVPRTANGKFRAVVNMMNGRS